MRVLKSDIDSSINFVEQNLIGFIESRYVRRTEEYFICYLSSQSGCNRMCKFCHLTATGQTQFKNCGIEDFVSQAKNVFGQYKNDAKANFVHFNFMSRGEPLANPNVTDNSSEVLFELGKIALSHNLPSKFNISTIMPLTMRKSLVDMFPIIHPTMYYSLYSINPDFRQRWIPAALDPEESLRLLADYQKFSKKIVKFHGAFIEGQNDSPDDIKAMMAAITRHGIIAEWNIVRYNPYSVEQGVETSEQRLLEIATEIGSVMPCKIVSRLDPKTYASCGMFVPK